MNLSDLGDVIKSLGAVAGALVAIGGLLHYVVVRPVKKWITERVAEVHGQLLPNGGKSLADKITRIEATQDQQCKAITAQGQQISALVQRFDAHIDGRQVL